MRAELREGGPELLACSLEALDSAATISFLPLRMGSDEVVFAQSSLAVAKVLGYAGIDSRFPRLEQAATYRDERSLTWLGPILFFSAATISENPSIISVALGVVANYLTEIFRSRQDKPIVKLRVVKEVQISQSYREVDYQGPIDGLLNLPAILESTLRENNGRDN